MQQRCIRTLVVEDSPTAMRAVTTLLESHPEIALVGVAWNGEDGLKQAQLLLPDLVLTDMEMPVMGGFQLTEILRKKFPAMRLVVISVHENSTWQDLSRDCGADAFVTKHRLSGELERLVNRLFPKVDSFDAAGVIA